MAVEQGINQPINLGSGGGVTIKEVATTIAQYAGKKVEWDLSKPMGDSRRIMNMDRASQYGFSCDILLSEGIKKTIDWFRNASGEQVNRYNPFTEQVLQPNS